MRHTDAPFSPGEAVQIRRMLEADGPCFCPRCRTRLEGSNSAAEAETGGVVVCQLIRCPNCRRMLTIEV